MGFMRLYTAEEYAELEDDRRTELVRGVIQVLGPVLPAHAFTVGRDRVRHRKSSGDPPDRRGVGAGGIRDGA